MIAGNRLSVVNCGICFLGLALVIAGYLGPWALHETTALTVTGFELAEFAKFFPQVQGGAVSITRELFYCPLVAAAILLCLLASQSTSRAMRLLAPLVAATALFGILLPYSVVDAARQALTARTPFALDPRSTRQISLLVAGAMLALLTPLAHRLPRRALSILGALLALAGTALPLWQFARLRPLIDALYAQSISLGWGPFACAAGFALSFWGTVLVGGGARSESNDNIAL